VDADRAAALNREWWDAVRRQRDAGLIRKHHDVAADLRAGKTALSPDQRRLLGDVRGKRLLDLGCGDGMELVEWALAGAEVTGVDNSPVQLAAAQRTADAMGVRCRLVLADLLRLPEELLRGAFDVVFSSYVTAWIGDLDAWFGAAQRALRPGGVFLLTAGHPVSRYAEELQRGEAPRRRYDDPGPFVEEVGVDPVWNPAGEPHTTVEWKPTLGALLTAVGHAGLRITDVAEGLDVSADEGAVVLPNEVVVRAVRDPDPTERRP
jgi:SAM-dependent methyltransferase